MKLNQIKEDYNFVHELCELMVSYGSLDSLRNEKKEDLIFYLARMLKIYNILEREKIKFRENSEKHLADLIEKNSILEDQNEKLERWCDRLFNIIENLNDRETV